jgi:hypothetical protein
MNPTIPENTTRLSRHSSGKFIARSLLALSITTTALWSPASHAQCSQSGRFHFIALQNNDGTNGPLFNSSQVAVWVSEANSLFSQAGVTFNYEPAHDWEVMNDTELNTYNQGSSAALRNRAIKIANERPGKIVVFVSKGLNNAFAAPEKLNSAPWPYDWAAYEGVNHIVTTGLAVPRLGFWNSATQRLEDHDFGTFLHEVGHYLGLYHTHPTTGGLSYPQVQQLVQANDSFDGDGISDTPPDPSPGGWLLSSEPANCNAATTTVSGRTFNPIMTNVMSYHGCWTFQQGGRPTLTAGQIARIQQQIQNGTRWGFCNTLCSGDFHGKPIIHNRQALPRGVPLPVNGQGAVDAETCMLYWKYRGGLGPRAFSVDPSGTVAAASIQRGYATWQNETDRVLFENTSGALAIWGFTTHQYAVRPNNIAWGVLRLPVPSGEGRVNPNVVTQHRLSASAFSSAWSSSFAAGRALSSLSVTSSSPLEFSASWVCRGARPGTRGGSCGNGAPGFTSATYYSVAGIQSVRNSSSSFFGDRIRLDRLIPQGSGLFTANWNRSQALRGAYESTSSGYQGLYDSLSPLGYRIHDIEYGSNGTIFSVWQAPHNECHIGSRLRADTDSCTQSICTVDPFCCNSQWDQVCVNRVATTCSRSCGSLTRPTGDFGDVSQTNLVLWRPSTGTWINETSSGPDPVWGGTGSFTSDVPVSADYDGDGLSEVAVWRPSTGNFMVRNGPTVQWGVPTDLPVVGDWTGDGVDDFAVWRPSDLTWYVKNGSTLNYEASLSIPWGPTGSLFAVPLPGDIDGDLRTDYAVYVPSLAQFRLRRQSGDSRIVSGLGAAGSKGLIGDYNGDGAADLAAWEPATGNWIVRSVFSRQLGTWSESPLFVEQWGTNGDVPLAGDYNGDGRSDLVVFRPSNSTFYVKLNTSTGFVFGGAVPMGASGDVPVLRLVGQ